MAFRNRTRIGNTPTCPLCNEQHGSCDECVSPVTLGPVDIAMIQEQLSEPTYAYDYKHQAWIENGRYVACGHTTICSCYGRIHAGELIAIDAEIR